MQARKILFRPPREITFYVQNKRDPKSSQQLPSTIISALMWHKSYMEIMIRKETIYHRYQPLTCFNTFLQRKYCKQGPRQSYIYIINSPWNTFFNLQTKDGKIASGERKIRLYVILSCQPIIPLCFNNLADWPPQGNQTCFLNSR